MADRSAFVALYAKGSEPEKILEEIMEMIAEANKDITPKDDFDVFKDNYLILEFKNNGEASQFVNTTCGKELKSGLPILNAIVNTDKMEEIYNALVPDFSSRYINESVFDLGNVPKIIGEKLENFGVGSFIILLAACFCAENEARKKITKMSFINDGINKPFIFYSLKKYFPKVRKVAVIGNGIASDQSFVDNMKKNSKIKILTKQEEVKFLPEEVVEENQKEVIITSFYTRPDPRLVTLGDPVSKGRCYIKELEEYEPVGIDPDEFPTNQFIIDFLGKSWNKLGEIGTCYSQDAVFSMTAQDGGPGSSLERFEKFSRNMIKNSSNFVIGPSDIVSAQKEIFIQGFYACPTEIQNAMIDDDMYAVVIHGAFQNAFYKKVETPEFPDDIILVKEALLFDRTLAITEYSHGRFYITNDHVYIHNHELE